MQIGRILAGYFVAGLALLAGCPFDASLDGRLSEPSESEFVESDAQSSDAIFAAGSYSGTLTATSDYQLAGDTFFHGESGSAASVSLSDDGILTSDGTLLTVGYTDTLDVMPTMQLSRVAAEVELRNWGYHVRFDVRGEWKNVPLVGTHHIDYAANSDGTVELFDTLELTSLDRYDGDPWEIIIEGRGRLTRASGEDSGSRISGDRLERKTEEAEVLAEPSVARP